MIPYTEVQEIIAAEEKRLEETLGMIPSENYASKAVREALGSVLVNKYAEGYPKKRYYAGNEQIDAIEELAQQRAKTLFGAQHANVQPHSGSPANLAVYTALAKPGDKIMGLALAHGGHLTHGHKVSITGQLYTAVQYNVDPKTHLLNYESIRKQAVQEKPKILVAGATAYPRTIDFKQMHEIATEVGAISMVDMSHIAGLVSAGVHPSPLPFTDIVTTTTHKTLRGPRGALILTKEAFAEKIDKAVFPGLQGGPHAHTIAAIAVALQEAATEEFRSYAKQIVTNAQTLATTLTAQGIEIITGGTDNHLLLLNVTKNDLTGQQAETLLEQAGIVTNKNTIPFDTRPPRDPSGIRLGTPMLTTRGMQEKEMQEIGGWIAQVLKQEVRPNEIQQKVQALCAQFPLR